MRKATIVPQNCKQKRSQIVSLEQVHILIIILPIYMNLTYYNKNHTLTLWLKDVKFTTTWLHYMTSQIVIGLLIILRCVHDLAERHYLPIVTMRGNSRKLVLDLHLIGFHFLLFLILHLAFTLMTFQLADDRKFSGEHLLPWNNAWVWFLLGSEHTFLKILSPEFRQSPKLKYKVPTL